MSGITVWRALSSAIKNEKIDIRDELTNAEWRQFFHLAVIHDVLPLIINSVYQCESLKTYEVLTQRMIRRGRIISINQAQKTADFALLYQQMNEEGLKPLVMKSIICRNLYETPELRHSSDEDMLIFPWQIEKYHDFLMNNGFRLVNEDFDIEKADEISYKNEYNHLYWEVHKFLFSLDEKAYSELNALFSILEDRITETIYQDIQLYRSLSIFDLPCI